VVAHEAGKQAEVPKLRKEYGAVGFRREIFNQRISPKSGSLFVDDEEPRYFLNLEYIFENCLLEIDRISDRCEPIGRA